MYLYLRNEHSLLSTLIEYVIICIEGGLYLHTCSVHSSEKTIKLFIANAVNALFAKHQSGKTKVGNLGHT